MQPFCFGGERRPEAGAKPPPIAARDRAARRVLGLWSEYHIRVFTLVGPALPISGRIGAALHADRDKRIEMCVMAVLSL
jgi:hypothetical protein